MAAHLETWSKEEIRAVIRFLNAKSLNPTEIHKELQSVYGEPVISRTQVYHWCNLFEAGHFDLTDREGRGGLITATSEDNEKRVDELIRQDRREAIRRKRSGQLTNGVILQHDNATPHTARVTQGWLEKYGWEILPHPSHSPDLAPSDYHLFGPLKRELAEESALMTMKSLLTMCGNGYKTLTEVSSERVSIPWCGFGRSVLTDLVVT
ncbi:histone-lysine N-methyltransferase SETMAR [Elysia marginata]|uniref:Histone-lysine N-methyltransferase SETMAR n=1 Tax=Elysia marginata TaxID=1093978 RepID=A0AAV4I3D9_9GAST|nr:histone-lysine N-methyltransferase SETMAR [Elysia marginata]